MKSVLYVLVVSSLMYTTRLDIARGGNRHHVHAHDESQMHPILFDISTAFWSPIDIEHGVNIYSILASCKTLHSLPYSLQIQGIHMGRVLGACSFRTFINCISQLSRCLRGIRKRGIAETYTKTQDLFPLEHKQRDPYKLTMQIEKLTSISSTQEAFPDAIGT